MKLSDYIVLFLKTKGIDIVFGYAGGAITHLMDSLEKSSGIQFIQTYHEQTAAFAAEGYGWKSGNIGVAIATSGPGATNLITGIADAFFDSTPTLFITGQVNTYEYKGQKPIRQQGFQETDIVSIVEPITKYARMVMDAAQIRYELEKAFWIAKSGRPGPVLLDLPMDIQRAEINPENLHGFDPEVEKSEEIYMGNFSRDEFSTLVRNSLRPVILSGGGVITSGAQAILLKYAERNSIPVVTSLLGKGAFPEDHVLSVGMIGSYGNRCANLVLANADLVLVLGSRMDTRQTGTNLDSFVRKGTVVRVDLDPDEMQAHRLKNVKCIFGDIKTFLENMCRQDVFSFKKNYTWLKYVSRVKKKYSQENEVSRFVTNKAPYRLMEALNQCASDEDTFCVDIGQNQMFSAQTLQIRKGQSFKTSGGMAPMGFAVPVAIGACFANKRSGRYIAIVGDGGLHISLQALMLLSQYSLPIKVVLLNNESLGMITQFQDLYFDRRKAGTTKESGYLVPDFKAIAQAYSISYSRIESHDLENRALIQKIFSFSDGPSLIEVMVGAPTVVSPKLEVNRPIEEISPQLDLCELQKNMLIDLNPAREELR